MLDHLSTPSLGNYQPFLAAGARSVPARIEPSCVKRLQLDGCSSLHGVHKCADCAEKHAKDLLAANCTTAGVEKWCESKRPPAPAPAPSPPAPAGNCSSAARGGTEACQWAGSPTSLAEAAAKLFPELGPAGPDLVWYTLGGNDFANHHYQNCSKTAKTFSDEMACIGARARVLTPFPATVALLASAAC
eukprot:SAG22_NODE_294_length_12872_cov_47.391372_6_plen_189_part_00